MADGFRCVSLADRPELCVAAARLLASHWPGTGAAARVHQMRAALAASSRSASGLPLHLLLLTADGRLAAHCRLQRAAETVGEYGGFSAALTSLIVHPDMRGQGVGRAMLTHAETSAAQLGFGYLYLWTPDAAGFYEACGYRRCEPISLLRPALIGVQPEALVRLEAMMAGKAGRAAETSGGPSETVALSTSVWLRKRLLERGGVRRTLLAADLRARVHHVLASDQPILGGESARAGTDWDVFTLSAVTWERQVGPCCGICALRMARSALRAENYAAPMAAVARSANSSSNGDSTPYFDAALKQEAAAWETADNLVLELRLEAQSGIDPTASVLQMAVQRKYSSDGEVFDIHHLANLAAETCGLHAVVLCGAGALQRLLRWIRAGGVAIVPYDAAEGTHTPAKRAGHGAHYALVAAIAVRKSPEGKPPARLEAFEPVVFLLHGLSPNLLPVRASVLWESCAQLVEMKPSHESTWVVGEHGIRLSGRCLLLA